MLSIQPSPCSSCHQGARGASHMRVVQTRTPAERRAARGPALRGAPAGAVPESAVGRAALCAGLAALALTGSGGGFGGLKASQWACAGTPACPCIDNAAGEPAATATAPRPRAAAPRWRPAAAPALLQRAGPTPPCPLTQAPRWQRGAPKSGSLRRAGCCSRWPRGRGGGAGQRRATQGEQAGGTRRSYVSFRGRTLLLALEAAPTLTHLPPPPLPPLPHPVTHPPTPIGPIRPPNRTAWRSPRLTTRTCPGLRFT